MKGCDFDQLESLRLESENFQEKLRELAGKMRSNRGLQVVVSRIAVKFGQLQESWNWHSEHAIEMQQECQRKLSDTMKSEQLSVTGRVKALEEREDQMEWKERELCSTLTGLTQRLRDILEQTEQALEEQRLKRDMHVYEQREMLNQADAELSDMLELGRPETLNVTQEFDELMDEIQAGKQSGGLEMSMEKNEGAWDSDLESLPNSPDASLSPKRLKKALMVLKKVHLLNNVIFTQNPDLLRQLEALLAGPDVTENLELFLQMVKYKALPSDLAGTTPKHFRPSDQLLDKTVLSTNLFPAESGEMDGDGKTNEDQWGDQKTHGGLPPKGSGQTFASPRTLRFAHTLLQAKQPRPAPLQESKLMYQLTKRSSTFSTKASSGLRSKMLKGSGDMAFESPYHPNFY